jgi:RHS repeat-associated protein
MSAQFGSVGTSPTTPESPETAKPVKLAADDDQAYNSAGQVTGSTFQLGQSSESNSYTYDADSQLLSSSGASDDTYGYDPNGNRDTTGYTVGTGNELTNSPGVTYTYDNVGNIITATTSSGTTTYTYDYQNQLTNVEANGVMVATYTYNALGQRIGIKDSGTQTWTVYNGKSADANPYADFNSSGSLQTRYLDGLAVDQILGQTSSSGSTEWYLTDQLGSVVAIASTSAVLDQITYDPFGNIVTQTNATDAVRFGFAGMEYDSVTGLYYDHARYYDAAIGRFTTQDPKSFSAGDTNLYRYVGNAPTADVDPSGLIDTDFGLGAWWPSWLGYVDLNGGSGVGGGAQIGPSNYGPDYLPAFHLYLGVQGPGGSVSIAPYQTPTPGVNAGIGGYFGLGGQVGVGWNPVAGLSPFGEVGAGGGGGGVGGWIVTGDLNPINSIISIIKWFNGDPIDSSPPPPPARPNVHPGRANVTPGSGGYSSSGGGGNPGYGGGVQN